MFACYQTRPNSQLSIKQRACKHHFTKYSAGRYVVCEYCGHYTHIHLVEIDQFGNEIYEIDD